MKLNIPEIKHTPFVTIPRFIEMTGLSQRQVIYLIKNNYLPSFKFKAGKQLTKSNYINLLEIQTKLSEINNGIIEFNDLSQ